MRKITGVLLTALMVTASPAYATIIDFELGAPTLFLNQVPLTNEFAGSGVNFQGDGEVLNLASFSSVFNTPTGARSGTDAIAFSGLVPADQGGPVNGPEVILFDSGQTSVSMFVANAFGNFDVTLEAFDDGNNLIGDITAVIGDAYTQIAFTAGSGSAIHSVSINSAANVWVIDDLEFLGTAVTSVPEPASMALFGIGLMGLVRCRRRRPA